MKYNSLLPIKKVEHRIFNNGNEDSAAAFSEARILAIAKNGKFLEAINILVVESSIGYLGKLTT